MIEIVVHPPRQHAEGEMLITWESRADGRGATDGRYVVHDGGHCASLFDGGEARRALAMFRLPGVVVDNDGRLVVDADENDVPRARLLVAAAIEQVETWCAIEEEARQPAPIPARGTHADNLRRMRQQDTYGASR